MDNFQINGNEETLYLKQLYDAKTSLVNTDILCTNNMYETLYRLLHGFPIEVIKKNK